MILLVAAGAMRAGSFTVGDFALFVYYLELVGEFPTQLAQLLVGLKQTSVAVRRMDELMTDAPAGTLARGVAVDLGRDPPDVPVYTKAPTDLLRDVRVEGLTFRYGGDGRGVSGVSFALARGSLTLVVGRVGSGKTTLLRVFLGLLPASSGTWYWNGTEVDDPSAVLRPPRVAYTPQVPRLFSESLRDNILMGLHGETVDLMGAVRAAALESDIADLERGMDTIVGPRGTRLSGGQIQRSAAARMFVRDPELLVFDDLSSALDVKTERVLWESLSKLLRARSATCLAVSHRREALRHADRILLLRDGCVSAMGSPAELMETCPDLRELFPDQEG